MAQSVVVVQEATAQFDNRDFVAEAPNPTQGFDQRVGFRYRIIQL
jgi:hypothetical protein